MLKKVVFQSFVGICFGAFVSVMVYYGVYLFGGIESFEAPLFIKNTTASIFCGWFFSVGALIFALEHWSLAKRTVVHFLIVTSLYFILAIGVGWLSLTTTQLILGVLFFLVVYGLIWLSCYVYFSYQAKKLNDSLNM
ncbi:DUF3021 domain-containing protein [Salimicrobium halophilum]|uniref:DUF3021 domain-containing protein n=1 Tax=Salimicrobium halophilum TaxID=86666 RepID=A0A1G8RHZ4_9BACI|nr:DUF3021 domain-containing protein [Salimicrobium halophilum]SDJ16571.1 Protein of unknown function [Salimicrobium halophilum]